MTAPRLATTRPAALTGRVGQGGDNRIHDVALVQALLGLKRATGGRMYLSGDHVTGKLDRPTAEALLRFRLDQRDANIRQPLARSGPIFNRLAQGQALAVLEGTATPYKLATLAEPGPIRGLKAKELSATRTTELMQVMKDFIRDWGIAFDTEIARAPGNAYAFVARFTPRHFSVHNGRRLSPVMSNAVFRGIAKELHDALAADLQARCAEAFGIKDQVDVKIQQGLKDELACVVRTELEGVEAFAQLILVDFRKKDFKLAARFLEHYLGASGQAIDLSRDEALNFDLVRNAVQENVERFKQRNFIAPEQGAPGSSVVEGIAKDSQTRVAEFQDHWKVDISFSIAESAFVFLLGNRAGSNRGSLAFGAGSSSVASTGGFLLRRQGDQILVTGTIVHVWTDPGFDFNPGQSFHSESQILQRHGKARPFQWKAEWRDEVEGLLQIENPFQPDAALRWVSFETHFGS